MMKDTMLKSAVLLLIGIFSTAFSMRTYCDAQMLKHEVIKELKPDFKYDSSEITRFAFTTEKQEKEIKVPLFIGEDYRMIFNTKGVPSNLRIKVTNRKGKVIFDNKEELEKEKDIFVFEPKKGRNLTVHYTIPPSSEENVRGCVVFLLGYKL